MILDAISDLRSSYRFKIVMPDQIATAKIVFKVCFQFLKSLHGYILGFLCIAFSKVKLFFKFQNTSKTNPITMKIIKLKEKDKRKEKKWNALKRERTKREKIDRLLWDSNSRTLAPWLWSRSHPSHIKGKTKKKTRKKKINKYNGTILPRHSKKLRHRIDLRKGWRFRPRPRYPGAT